MVNGKHKGNAFERYIANYLTEQYGDKFMRTAHSGAYTGKSNFYRRDSMTDDTQKAFVGDILAPKGYHVVCECKAYAEITGGIKAILLGESKVIEEWVGQLLDDSQNEVPHILFFKLNNLGTYFVLPDKFFHDVNLDKNFIAYTSYFVERGKDMLKYYIISLDNFQFIKNEIKRIING